MKSRQLHLSVLIPALFMLSLCTLLQAGAEQQTYPFKLPELGYDYKALEPHIDARTLEIHHSKHHAGYVRKLNDALEQHEYLHNYTLEELLQNIEAVPEEIRDPVNDNAGGHLHHALFWENLKPGGSKEPAGEILTAIKAHFCSVDNFKDLFASRAGGRVGSGWTWLAMDPFGKLHVFSTTDHNSPISEGFIPLLVIDVWEHAYYLKYQNRRTDFIDAFWNLVNWDVVNERYVEAKKMWRKKATTPTRNEQNK